MKKKLYLDVFKKFNDLSDICDHEMIVEILEEMSRLKLNELYHTRWSYSKDKPINYIYEVLMKREDFTKGEQKLVPKLTSPRWQCY